MICRYTFYVHIRMTLIEGGGGGGVFQAIYLCSVIYHIDFIITNNGEPI